MGKNNSTSKQVISIVETNAVKNNQVVKVSLLVLHKEDEDARRLVISKLVKEGYTYITIESMYLSTNSLLLAKDGVSSPSFFDAMVEQSYYDEEKKRTEKREQHFYVNAGNISEATAMIEEFCNFEGFPYTVQCIMQSPIDLLCLISE